MNLKKLLSLSFLLVFFVAFTTTINAQVLYLNSTDGDDSYTGANPTNDPLGTGPKRTLEGAFEGFADGSVVYMSAGNYNIDQSGIGGGNDGNGYTLPAVAANKSMTFVVQTYNSNNVVVLNGGPLVLQNGTGTIKFQAQDAGVQSMTFSGASITLTSGTLDVSDITFNVAATTGTLTRTAGSVIGAPVFANNGMAIIYNGAASLTAGGELPATVNTLTLSHTAGTITFPNAITFNTTAGGIANTTGNDATFNGLVTLKANGANATPTINNTIALADWTFAGGVTVSTTVAANGTPITNGNTGSVNITGPLTFEQQDVAAAANVTHVSDVTNTAAGSLKLTGGVLETQTTDNTVVATSIYTAKRIPTVNFNIGAGTASLGGGTSTTITGTYGTAAATTTTLTGPVTVIGVITNAGTTATGGNTLTVTNAGAHTSAGNITGSGTVAFDNKVVTTWNGAGQLPNIEGTSETTLTIAAATTITGNVVNKSKNLMTLTAATTISGGISIEGAGGITLGAGGTVAGNVSISGAGVLTTATTQFDGSVTMTNGGFTLGGNATLMGDYNQSGGALVFGANTLDVKSNFVRTAGTVTAGTGTLQFSAGGTQTFTGGTNMQVYNFSVTAVGTGVNFVNGSLEVLNDATIVANTNVQLGSLNIRMLGQPAAPGNVTFTNAGQYTSTGGGGIIFEGPSAGSQHRIAGNGINSNIEVRLADETATVDVVAGQTVTWSGNLTITRGTIDVLAGSVLNPSTALVTPSFIRNLGNASAPAGADGKPLVLTNPAGFNATNQPYNLTYYGNNMSGPEVVGPEFVTGATAMVINFTVTATGNTVQVPLAAGPVNYPFSGNLSVANSVVLDLTGASNLVSTGTGRTHSVKGTINSTGGGALVLDGTGTLTGGLATAAPADASSIAVITSDPSDTYAINDLKVLGTLTTTSGTTNLAMGLFGSPADQGNVTNINVTDGSLVLTADADLDGTVNVGTNGTLDFADQNLYILGGASFNANASSVLKATAADTRGYLVYEGTPGNLTGNLNTDAAVTGTTSALVPRIKINNGVVVTMTQNAGFSDIFTDYDANGPGTLNIGGKIFNAAGNIWNLKSANYNTAGGIVLASDSTTVNAMASTIFPNLTIDNENKVFTLVDADGVAATVPTITVPGTLTFTKGALNLNTVDIALTNAGAALAYTAGTITATSTDGLGKDDVNGEIILNNAGGAQTFAVGTTKMEVPNLTVTGANGTTLSTTNPFKVTERLVFGQAGGAFTFGADNRMELGDSSWIEKRGNGHLDKVPMFGTAHNIAYTTASSTVEDEMPAAGTILQDLYFDAGAGNTVTGAKALKVNNALYLTSGAYTPVVGKLYALEMGDSTTVTRTLGTITDAAVAPAVYTITGGPIHLVYDNTGAIATTSQEYPADITVLSLSVLSPGAGDHLTLHADRTAGDLILNTGTTPAAAPITTVQFDLDGNDFTVTNASTATLTRGTLINGKAAVPNPSTLNVAGLITATSNVVITDVNLVAATAELACAFGQSVGAPVTSATVTGDATFAGFNGNATVAGDITLNGAFAGSLTVNGKDAQALAMKGNQTINKLTLNMTGTAPVLSVSGGNLSTAGATDTDLTFVNGILNMVGDVTLVLPNPNATTFGLGYDRSGVTGTNVGHVVGNISRLANKGDGLAGRNGRFEYPTGTLDGEYRPAAISFTTDNPVINATRLVIGHVNSNPEGSVGLPTSDGQVGDYSPFYWLVKTDPVSVTTNQLFDMELQAKNVRLNFTDAEDLRIIRRKDGNAQINKWEMQGVAENYNNYLQITDADSLVNVRTAASTGGLEVAGSRFTIGAPAQGPAFTLPTQLAYTVNEDATLAIPVKAISRDVSATLTGIKMVSGPDYASFKAEGKDSGAVALAPKLGDATTTADTLVLKVTDSEGASAEIKFTIKVTTTPVNLAFTKVINDTTVKAGNVFSFQYAAKGGDGTYTYSIVAVGGTASDTASITSAGLLTWTPKAIDAGKVSVLTVQVKSGTDSVTTVDSITVVTNTAPSWAAAGASFLPDTTVYVGDTLKWTYKAIDADGDVVTYKFGSNFPEGEASIDANTGVFEWAPKTASAFPVIVPVYASDSEDSTLTEARVTIKVITVAVTGKVKYNVSNLPIANAEVTLKDANGAVVATDSTDDTGAYAFASVTAGDYTVTASKTNGYGGVLASDALEVQKYEAGDTKALATALQKVAADVDKSGEVDAIDALIILNRSVDNKLESFTLADWQFETKPVKVTSTGGSADIMGICAGDARSDYDPAGGIAKSAVSFDNSEVQKIKKSAEFKLPVAVREAAEVGSFTLKFRYPADQIEFLGVVGSGIVSNVDGDVISLAWANAKKPLNLKEEGVLAQLRFKAVDGFEKGSEAALELLDGSEITDVAAKTLASTVAVSNITVGIPESFDLSQNYPNPFNPTTTIKYGLPANGKVSLTVFNTLGQAVRTLVDTKQEAGEYEVKFNAQSMASGVYLYRIIVTGGAKDFVQTKKMLLLK